LIVEALSFKLALNFLEYLKKNRITTSGIKILFWDRINNEFTTYENIDTMSSYFNEQYAFVDNCVLGSLCSIEVFNGTSNLYDFTTEYTATNITGSYKLVSGSQYDRQRNSQRGILIDRQINFINQAVSEYLKFYNEIRRIYVTGIYSPCYAEPGWSQGTLYLKKLREGILINNQNTFPKSIPASISQNQLNVANDYEVQKKKKAAILNNEILIITNRIDFVEDIINNNININTTSINDIITYLGLNGFDLVNGNYDYLLNMPIYSLNAQTLLELYQLKTDVEAEIAML